MQYLKVIDIISDYILLFRKPLDAYQTEREAEWNLLCAQENINKMGKHTAGCDSLLCSCNQISILFFLA